MTKSNAAEEEQSICTKVLGSSRNCNIVKSWHQNLECFHQWATFQNCLEISCLDEIFTNVNR